MEDIYRIADYFLSKESMSHKKLQKLCYYAQGWYLANYNRPLIPNRFEAWAYGPVSPDLYTRYHDQGWADIPKPTDSVEFNDHSVDIFLDKVYETYGHYTADELENITHMEEPWRKARGDLLYGEYSRRPIAIKDMRDFYAKKIGKVYDYILLGW